MPMQAFVAADSTQHAKQPDTVQSVISINQYILDVLGGNWDPTAKKFSSVSSYTQVGFLHAKHSLMNHHMHLVHTKS